MKKKQKKPPKREVKKPKTVFKHYSNSFTHRNPELCQS
jgi:hypothetical protein